MSVARPLLVLVLLLAGAAAGQDRDPGAGEIDAAIRDLGSTDFAVREEATARLARMGPAAVPALRLALEDADPEIRWRAARLLERLAPAAPEVSRTPPRVPGSRVRLAVRIENGERAVEFEEDGRLWRFLHKGDGRIEGVRPGEDGSVPFSYADEEAMREADPELHGRYTGERGGVRVYFGGRPIGGVFEAATRRDLGLVAERDPSGDGLRVVEVREGGRAAAAGLRPGDVIAAAQGRPVEGIEALRRLLEALDPAEPIRLTVTRGGDSREVTIR